MPIIRRPLAALLLAAAFGCTDGSVTAPVSSPGTGVHALRTAAGADLPALVQRVVESETGMEMQVYVLSDTLELDDHGRYQQRAVIEVRAGDVVIGRSRWVDRGTYTLDRGRAHFESDYLQNVTFDGVVSAGSLRVMQDLVGEGTAVEYVFQPVR